MDGLLDLAVLIFLDLGTMRRQDGTYTGEYLL